MVFYIYLLDLERPELAASYCVSLLVSHSPHLWRQANDTSVTDLEKTSWCVVFYIHIYIDR